MTLRVLTFIFYFLALQKHYRAVEAIALDRESVEEVKDLTSKYNFSNHAYSVFTWLLFSVPNVEWMERKAEKEMQSFCDAVFSENYEAGGKRKVNIFYTIFELLKVFDLF